MYCFPYRSFYEQKCFLALCLYVLMFFVVLGNPVIHSIVLLPYRKDPYARGRFFAKAGLI